MNRTFLLTAVPMCAFTASLAILAGCGSSSDNAGGSTGSGTAGSSVTSGGAGTNDMPGGSGGTTDGPGGSGVAGSADTTSGAGTGDGGGGAAGDGAGSAGDDSAGPGPGDGGTVSASGGMGGTGGMGTGGADGRGTAGAGGSATTGPGLPASGGNPPKKFTNNGLACGATATWGNKSTQGLPDPSMSKQGNKYYAFGTGGGSVTSTDLITWSRGGSLFPNGLPSWTKQYIAAPGLWAPDIHLVDGTYYAYYSISAWGNYDSSIGVATSSSLDGPWTDHGDVVDYKTGGSGVNVIDPDLFVDDDGTRWLIYGSYKSGLRLIQIDPKTGLSLGGSPKPTLITKSLGEGSDIIKHDGFYYVFASRGSCCNGLKSTYQVVMGRAKAVTGPYVGTNGEQWVSSAYTVFLTGDSDHPGVGGQSFFRDTDDQLYMVYMAYTAPSGNAILNVRPIWFDANDWPTLDPCKAATY